jgi:non-heme chloroperoxidase
MPFIAAKDGTKLHFDDWGSGPPVVLIHGWPLDARMWEYQASALVEEGLRVITYDRRGFGRSEQPWSGYDYDTLADDLAALLHQLDLRAVTLVGFSMGGGEVARYLSRHGASRIARAVLVSSVTPFLLRTEEHDAGLPKAQFDGMIKALDADRPGFLAKFGKLFYGAGLVSFSISDEILRWTEFLALHASKRATSASVRAWSETDFRPDMRAFTIPTLVIHGDADKTVPIEISAREAVKLMPRAELREYAGAPHGLFYTDREKLNADLLLFIKS